MSGKRKKKEAVTAGANVTAGAGGAATAARPRRRRLVAVAIALLLSSATIAGLSALPGYEDPNRDFNECHKRIGRLSTALMEWAREHEGRFPGSLVDLKSDCISPGSDVMFECPASGKTYRYFGAGLEFIFCDRAVVLACPDGRVHGYSFRDASRGPAELALYLGADLRIHAEHPAPGSADRSVSIGKAMARRLEEQSMVMSLSAAARSDPAAARRLHAVALDSSRLDETRALAAWATGMFSDPGAKRALQACLASSRQYTNGVGVASASALLRQGDVGGVEYLIHALECDNWSLRDAACAALEFRFKDAQPPMPPARPYLSGEAKPGTRAEFDRWWERWRAANR